MTRLIMALMLSACAYGGTDNSQPVYGHTKPPSNNSDAAPDPDDDTSFANPYNDPYTTLCLVNVVNGYDAGFSFFYVCDGRPFGVNDLVDPEPDNKK